MLFYATGHACHKLELCAPGPAKTQVWERGYSMQVCRVIGGKEYYYRSASTRTQDAESSCWLARSYYTSTYTITRELPWVVTPLEISIQRMGCLLFVYRHKAGQSKIQKTSCKEQAPNNGPKQSMWKAAIDELTELTCYKQEAQLATTTRTPCYTNYSC